MPQHCKLSRSRVLREAFSVTHAPLLDFLSPAVATRSSSAQGRCRNLHFSHSYVPVERVFFGAIGLATRCRKHKRILSEDNQVHHIPRRRAAHHAAAPDANARHHQRFDSSGRLLIETTASREPAFSQENYEIFDGVEYHEQQEKRKAFAATTKLPDDFFHDVLFLQRTFSDPNTSPTQIRKRLQQRSRKKDQPQEQENALAPKPLTNQLKLMQNVRDLEEKLAKAKRDLVKASNSVATLADRDVRQPTVLTKKDYLNLVDLYFYSRNSRFSPESSDDSPTPIILNDYSFTLSADFTKGDGPQIADDEKSYVSPLKDIEEMLKESKLREIAVMRVFVDLLLDDESPNRALYEAYQELPQPGVAYLPKGIVRLFLQRMSTPWVKTHASMLRYLSLIDDMQQAKLPITLAEWSSAIHLAGRSFNRVETDEVGRALQLWKQMEHEAGVQAGPVTFNILFDVAVRAGKFALGETILTEMHKRNLRLNRLGRVSLMYYHGLRGDGDGVRKAYHDFVEAGEIVDTLVLNCVIASLVNAQEPTAAEQIYQRMKDMQATLRRGWTDDGNEALFKLHPEPGSSRIGIEMASNYLGRILAKAPNLRETYPENHAQLQAVMPLTPNFTTFRIMIAHHSAVSGDLDRVTVLLKEMLENFDIPLFPVIFQMLFKGFAIHGPKGGPGSVWSKQRLDMVWDACRNAMKDSIKIATEEKLEPERTLPSITEVNTGLSSVDEAVQQGQPKARTLSLWEQLVVDLAAFPRERLKRLQRYSGQQFDDDVQPGAFSSPFFSQGHYSAPQPDLDEEEGEYTLPDPIKSTIANPHHEKVDQYSDEDSDELMMRSEDEQEDAYWDRPPSSPNEDFSHSAWSSFKQENNNESPRAKYRLTPSKPLVCWLLRAYARITGSRAQVEEVWGSVRKIWVPKDERDAEIVIKVLLRCLKDCDRLNGRG